MNMLKKTLMMGCFGLAVAVASMMMTSEASAQVVHVGPGGGGVHWGGGSVHWGGGGGHLGGHHGGHWGGNHGGHWGGHHGGGIIHPIQPIQPIQPIFPGNHWGGGHSWHNTTHLDYHPGQYVPHNGHLDWQPGHYDVHNTGHWDH